MPEGWRPHPIGALLTQAFVALTDVLAAPDEPAPPQILADIKQQLAAQPDGEAFVRQLDTARWVSLTGKQ